MSRPIREIESDLDDAIKARQAAEKAWDARVVMGNRWDEGWVRAQELDRLKTRVADLSGELRKAQQAALDAALAEPDAKREPATVEQVIAANGPPWALSATPDFFTGFRAAERFHGIRKEDT